MTGSDADYTSKVAERNKTFPKRLASEAAGWRGLSRRLKRAEWDGGPPVQITITVGMRQAMGASTLLVSVAESEPSGSSGPEITCCRHIGSRCAALCTARLNLEQPAGRCSAVHKAPAVMSFLTSRQPSPSIQVALETLQDFSGDLT